MAQHAGRARPTPPGPFDYWPTGSGFEYFYGFLAGEASQYEPNLVRNTTRAAAEDPGARATTSPRTSRTMRSAGCASTRPSQPDKPFFMYWARGAIHGPHQIMKEWADKYKGKFDDGWDAYRERVFKRAKEKGWIPQTRNSRRGPNRWRPGTASPRTRSRSSAA